MLLDSEVGPKAARVSELSIKGYPIPKGVVLSWRALQQCLKEQKIKKRDGVKWHDFESWKKLHKSLEKSILLKELAESVRKYFRDIGLSDISFAVRSSALCEDNPGSLTAGVFCTILEVPSISLESAIAEVWSRSLWAYQIHSHSLDNHQRIAVIIQEYISPELNGVSCSVAPTTGNPTSIVTIYNKKGSKRITDGEEGMNIIWDRLTNLSHPTKQRDGHNFNPQLQYELARYIDKLDLDTNSPVEVEWLYKNGQFVFTQFRPATVPQCNLSDMPTAQDLLKEKWRLSAQMPPLKPFAKGLSDIGTKGDKDALRDFDFSFERRLFWDHLLIRNRFAIHAVREPQKLLSSEEIFRSQKIFKICQQRISEFKVRFYPWAQRIYQDILSGNEEPAKIIRQVMEILLKMKEYQTFMWHANYHFAGARFEMLCKFLFGKDRIGEIYADCFRGITDRVTNLINQLREAQYSTKEDEKELLWEGIPLIEKWRARVCREYGYEFMNTAQVIDPSLIQSTWLENPYLLNLGSFIGQRYGSDETLSITFQNYKDIVAGQGSKNLEVFCNYVKWARTMFPWKNGRESYFSQAVAYFRVALRRRAEQLKFSDWKDMWYLYPEEIYELPVNLSSIELERLNELIAKRKRRYKILSRICPVFVQEENKPTNTSDSKWLAVKEFTSLGSKAAVTGYIHFHSSNLMAHSDSLPQIWVVEELKPVMVLQAMGKYVVAIIMEKGNLLSHSSILARSLNIPAAIIPGVRKSVKENMYVLLDIKNHRLLFLEHV